MKETEFNEAEGEAFIDGKPVGKCRMQIAFIPETKFGAKPSGKIERLEPNPISTSDFEAMEKAINRTLAD